MRFTVVLYPDARDGGYVARIPAIPGCTTQGETFDEAVAMARDAAEGMLAVMAEHGEDVPTEAPGTVVASVEVTVPALAGATG